jgi:hypothetical protein
MLILIAGSQALKRAQLRHQHVKIQLEELDGGISVEELATLASTPTLTGEARAFFLRNIFSAKAVEGEGSAESLRDALPDLARGLMESPHYFVLDEEKAPLKAALEKIKKAGAEVVLLDAEKKKESFNVFELANALQRRDRKALWLGLMRAKSEGISAENIAGVLAWKARGSIPTARGADRAVLTKLSRDLVVMYHDSHRGAGDLDLLLERFALTL